MSITDRKTGAAAELPFQVHARQLEKLPPCQASCPNSGDIRNWLGIIAQRENSGLSLDEAFDAAWRRLVEFNPLPATIGRICPHPCEDQCSRSDKDGAVSINAMERFLGDWGITRELTLPEVPAQRYEESVGVVGSGPASLSFAYQMAVIGYDVTIYDRDERPGGMLRHAIPDYRLPRDVLDAEIDRILGLGISLATRVDVGKDITLDQIREQHDLVFLGLGAQAARRLDIPGEDGPGVISGIEFLRRRKEGQQPGYGPIVLVIGGGNTAIDAARSARRDGCAVTLIYRRSEAEMPAAAHEIEDARSEGVEFRFLAVPTRIIRAEDAIRQVEVQGMRLGAPDNDGRRRPEAVAGRVKRLPADSIIVAISQEPGWDAGNDVLEAGSWLHPADDGKLRDRLFAGGDDLGPGVASRAVGQGRHAAESAHAELRGFPPPSIQPECPPLKRDSVRAESRLAGRTGRRDRSYAELRAGMRGSVTLHVMRPVLRLPAVFHVLQSRRIYARRRNQPRKILCLCFRRLRGLRKMHRTLPLRLSRGPERFRMSNFRVLLSGPDIRDRKTIDHYVDDVVDDDDQPCRHPRRRIWTKPGFPALMPWSAARPWSILEPRHVTSEVPAIDNEMRAADNRKRQRILRDEQERDEVNDSMNKRRQRSLRLLDGHPFALQYVIAYRVGY